MKITVQDAVSSIISIISDEDSGKLFQAVMPYRSMMGLDIRKSVIHGMMDAMNTMPADTEIKQYMRAIVKKYISGSQGTSGDEISYNELYNYIMPHTSKNEDEVMCEEMTEQDDN